jgi:serine/threonine protein kinase
MGQLNAKLEDKYYLQKVKLGQGSFGVVWKGVEKETSEFVAVKQMDKAALPRRGVRREDIEREVSVMKVVYHDNILKLKDFYEDSSYISFVLEYCDGGDFGDKVKERGSSLTENEAAVWMRMICSAIMALHQKTVCHRDIKPDNFMVSKGSIKLADFGLAILLPTGKLLTERCGTPAFMAPEQSKSRGYSHSVDMWAAGITMFMLLSGGRHPFVGADGRLNDAALKEGILDFSAQQGLMAVFGQRQGFSDAARELCKKMVNPNEQKRSTAEQALQDRWLRSASSAGAITQVAEQPRPRPPAEGGYTNAAAVQQPKRLPSGVEEQPDGVVRNKTWPFEVPPQLEQHLGWLGGALGFVGEENATPNVAPNLAPAPVIASPEAKPEDQRRFQKQVSEQQRQIEKLEQENSALKQATQRNRTDDRRQTNYQDRMKPPQTMVPGGGNPLAGKLPPRCKVRYHSSSYNQWCDALVESFNESNGTYNLNLRPHAALAQISPDPKATATEAWPTGTLVSYHSSSANRMLPATILSFVEGVGGEPGSYNLDLREQADVERIRPRLEGRPHVV